MKITSKKLGIATLTVLQILCVWIAAAFALDKCDNIYINALCAICYLFFACLFEYVKYKMTHNDIH